MKDDELLIERSFDAPLSVVFAIWAEAEHVKAWLGPRPLMCTHLDMDFRVGGSWFGVIEAPDNGRFEMGGIYKAIDTDRHLSFTFGPSPENSPTLVNIDFERRDGRTHMRFHQSGFATADLRDAHIGGWTGAFEKMGECIAAIAQESRV